MLNKYNKGITLLEIIIVICIIVTLAVIILPSLSNFKQQQSLKNTTEAMVSVLNNARSNTISSLNSSNYGVHFETNYAVLFAGSVYNSADPSNEEVYFDSTVVIPSIGGLSLNGGGKNVVFDRITGSTSNNGTIKLQLSTDTTEQRIININKVGVIGTN